MNGVEVGTSVVLSVKLTRDEGQLRLQAEAILSVDQAIENKPMGVRIFLDNEKGLLRLKTILDGIKEKKHNGSVIHLVLRHEQQEVELKLAKQYILSPPVYKEIQNAQNILCIENNLKLVF